MVVIVGAILCAATWTLSPATRGGSAGLSGLYDRTRIVEQLASNQESEHRDALIALRYSESVTSTELEAVVAYVCREAPVPNRHFALARKVLFYNADRGEQKVVAALLRIVREPDTSPSVKLMIMARLIDVLGDMSPWYRQSESGASSSHNPEEEIRAIGGHVMEIATRRGKLE
jgi:hypothetical protein